jgi:hypothetical protein
MEEVTNNVKAMAAEAASPVSGLAENDPSGLRRDGRSGSTPQWVLWVERHRSTHYVSFGLPWRLSIWLAMASEGPNHPARTARPTGALSSPRPPFGRLAQLSLLRWKYFVQAEDEAFMAALDAFTRATGVKIAGLWRV